MAENYYNAAVVADKQKYYKQIKEANDRNSSFSLGNIADAYGEELNGLMPEVEVLM